MFDECWTLSVPRLLDPISRTATVTNAVNDLIALHGLGGSRCGRSPPNVG